jgi:spore germination protein KB
MFAMLLFLIGSSVIWGVSLTTERNSWMVSLIAGGIGLLLFYTYVYIWRNNDFKSLALILNNNLGKHIGFVVSLVYVLYFAYLASRILTDLTFFINGTLLYTMHPFFIKSSIFLIVAYTYLKGLEAFIRSAVILGAIMLLFLLLLPLIIILSGNFSWEYVNPILSHMKIAGAVPTMIAFPFSEIIAFLMIFPFLNRKDRPGVIKKGSIVIIFFTILMSLFSFLIIGVLHPELAKNYTFPLITTIERVTVFDFIERLDILAVILFIIGGYFKTAIFTFSSIDLAKESMTRLNSKFLTFSILVFLFMISFFFSENIAQHLQIGLKIIPGLIHLPLGVLLPFCILIITFIKKKKSP